MSAVDPGEHRAGGAPLTDVRAIVCYIIGAVLFLAVALIGLLSYHGQPVPDVLQNVAVGSLTGLVGLLVKSPAP